MENFNSVDFLNACKSWDAFFKNMTEETRYCDFKVDELFSNALQRAGTQGRDQQTAKEDLRKLAMLATFRGCNFWQIFKSSTKDEQKWLKMVKRIYNLREKPNSSNDITLRRLAIAHAREISFDLHAGKITPTVDPRALAPDFPAAMCLSTFGSLLPYYVEGGPKMLEAFCYHQLLFEKLVFLEPEKRFTKREIWDFAFKKRSRGPYNMEERYEHLLKVNLLQKDGEELIINPAIMRAVIVASRKWFYA